MIKYRLACSAGHEFEGWFQSGAAYDVSSRARAGLLPALRQPARGQGHYGAERFCRHA